MSAHAWVTLATSDSYCLGALVLAHSLRRVQSVHPSVILITPGVTEVMRERLRPVFAEVIVVDVLDSEDAAHLALLARPELGVTFTKLHCWTLTQYEKCVFLDADTLVLQNCDELFDREELSAAPDVGWPDCFNSGVFVYRPSQETFQALLQQARGSGSFDGGDQGLLNTFFSSWAHGDISKHLPFLYNIASTAFYSYLPALKQFGKDAKIMHFIGNAKPWLQNFNWERRNVCSEGHLQPALQLWWDIFCSNVHANLDVAMAGIAGTFSRITLGEEGQREVIDESQRRQGWEAGNADYMGADSFDNIWAKISQTLTGASVPQPSEPTLAVVPPSEPVIVPEPVSVPEPVLVPEPVSAPEPVSGSELASVPEPVLAPEPAPVPESSLASELASATELLTAPAPTVESAATPVLSKEPSPPVETSCCILPPREAPVPADAPSCPLPKTEDKPQPKCANRVCSLM